MGMYTNIITKFRFPHQKQSILFVIIYDKIMLRFTKFNMPNKPTFSSLINNPT